MRSGGGEEAGHFLFLFLSLPLMTPLAESFPLCVPRLYSLKYTVLFTHGLFVFLLQRLWCERRGHRQQDRAGDGKSPPPSLTDTVTQQTKAGMQTDCTIQCWAASGICASLFVLISKPSAACKFIIDRHP